MSRPVGAPPVGTGAPAWRPRHAGAVVALVCLTLGACSRDLSRGEAKRLLETKTFEPKINIPRPVITCGADAGMFAVGHGAGQCLYTSKCYVPTEKAKPLVRSWYWYDYNGAADIQFSVSLRRVVTVTGLAVPPGMDASAAKVVEYTFTWNVDHLPQEFRSCLAEVPAQNGSAIFVRYDDGWRVGE